MADSMGVVHHIHKRKRMTHSKLLPFPNSRLGIRLLDNTILFLAIIGPLMNIPQIMKIVQTGSSAGVSLTTFGLYTIFNVVWLGYALVHKEKPLIIAYSCWLLSNFAVVLVLLAFS